MPRLTALFIISTLSLIALGVGSQVAQSQTFTVLHSFTGGEDGFQPYARPTLDRAGALYGTTTEGAGPGTVFQLKRTDGHWVLNTLFAFSPRGERLPLGGVVFGPDGTLYGTTYEGGSGSCQFGCGTVYNLRPPAACRTAKCPWTETVLYSFTGGADGSEPYYIDLIFDQAGNLYGTTAGGGSAGYGVVFKLTPSGSGWTESVIHSFTGSDGIFPQTGVIFDSTGNLYGTTAIGGLYGCGTVFQLSPSESDWVASTVYSFQGGADGCQPAGGVIVDRSGNLYGTTPIGGSGGGGTVFELSPSGGSWTYSLLYSWSGGWGPDDNLAIDAAGNLYGTTYQDGAYGSGSVFKLTPIDGGWSYIDLRDFDGYANVGGSGPYGGVTLDASGNLYGTTVYGGRGAGENCLGIGCGVVWEITP